MSLLNTIQPQPVYPLPPVAGTPASAMASAPSEPPAPVPATAAGSALNPDPATQTAIPYQAQALATAGRPYVTFRDMPGLTPADVLVVAAHPDDEFPMAGYIAELLRSGRSVQVVYATTGSAGEDVSGRGLKNDALGHQRMQEAASAMKALGNPRPPLFLDFMDGQTGAYPEALKEQLRTVLTQVRPGMALMLNSHDGLTSHPDHIHVAKGFERVLNELAAGRTPRDQADAQKVAPLLASSNVFQLVMPESAAPVFQRFFGNNPSWSGVRYQPDAVATQTYLPPEIQAVKINAMAQHASQYRPADIRNMAGYNAANPFEHYTRYQINGSAAAAGMVLSR
ncbi:MAG: PIG-L deacetylase family protein [Candidatus Melainabacteria bacterium]